MKIDDLDLVERIEEQWSPPAGFLFELREGLFDAGAYERLISLLRSIEDPDSDVVPRRVVSHLWYIPGFMGWQRHRVIEREGDVEALEKACVEIRNELELFGVP